MAHSPTCSYLVNDPTNSEMQFLSIITSASNRIIILPDALLNISFRQPCSSSNTMMIKGDILQLISFNEVLNYLWSRICRVIRDYHLFDEIPLILEEIMEFNRLVMFTSSLY